MIKDGQLIIDAYTSGDEIKEFQDNARLKKLREDSEEHDRNLSEASLDKRLRKIYQISYHRFYMPYNDFIPHGLNILTLAEPLMIKRIREIH